MKHMASFSIDTGCLNKCSLSWSIFIMNTLYLFDCKCIVNCNVITEIFIGVSLISYLELGDFKYKYFEIWMDGSLNPM